LSIQKNAPHENIGTPLRKVPQQKRRNTAQRAHSMTPIKVWVVSSLNAETRGPGCHFKSMNGICCTWIARKRHGNDAGWLKRTVTGAVAGIVGFPYKHNAQMESRSSQRQVCNYGCPRAARQVRLNLATMSVAWKTPVMSKTYPTYVQKI